MRSLRRALFIAALLLTVTSIAGAAGPTLSKCAFRWNDLAADFVSFNLYIGTVAGGPYTLVGTWPGGSGATAFGPTGNLCASLPDGQKFAVVKAVNAAGTEGGPSPEFPFVLNTAVPAPPSNLIIMNQ